MARRTPIYLLEKYTGLADEKGVELWYVFDARLTKLSAETDYGEQIQHGAVRIRKIYATK